MRDMARGLLFAVIALLMCARPAGAQVDQYVGKPIADVRLTIQGQPVTDADMADAVETRKGEPLSMALVRESIVHLMALSRFENVRVDAQASPGGVVLTYELAPLRTVSSIKFSGRLALSQSLLRGEVVERYGSSPPPGRRDDIAQTLEEVYRNHGFQKPVVRARLTNEARPDQATLTFEIDAGVQARVRQIRLEEGSQVSREDVLRKLHLREGGPFDPSQAAQYASAFADSMRREGFYTARVEVAPPQASPDGSTVDVTVAAYRGPRVTVDVKGAAIPGKERDKLLPIASERSVDEDLLEDWSNNIERYFRAQGYMRATAPFERQQSGDRQALTIVFNVSLGPQYRIDSVVVTGNRFLSTAEVVGLLHLQAGQPVVDRNIEVGVAAVAAKYRREGFTQVDVKPAIATQSMSSTEVREGVTVNVTEGPRTVLNSVAIACVASAVKTGGPPTREAGGLPRVSPAAGNAEADCAIPEATLRSALTASGPDGYSVVTGAPFYPPNLDRARDALLVQYLARGYQLATVGIELPADKMANGNRTSADVRFEIREGPQILVDHILLVGNNHTKASTIRKELQIHPGDPLDLDKLAESQRRLNALGLFRRVRVTELQHGTEIRRDLLVTVEEAPSTTLTYGGGIEGGKRLREVKTTLPDGSTSTSAVPAIELAPRVLFDIGRRNLWGKNRSINFSGGAVTRPSPTTTNLVGAGVWEYRAIGTYREPQIFHGAADLLATGGVDQAVRTSYSYNRKGVRAELAHRLSPAVTIYGRYSLERTIILTEQADVKQEVLIDRRFPNFRLSKLTGSIVRDTRDDALDPATGTLASAELHVAPRALGSEVGFAKTIFQGYVYRKLPVSRRVIFAGGVHLGLAEGFLGPVSDVPISERFFSGNAVRGFVEDRLGTPDTLTPDGFPSGGNALLIFNSELRVSIRSDLAAVAFVDAGNVFGRISELNLTEIRPSVGFGVRYKSPFGPFRLDIGFNPARRIYGGALEPLTSFYFGIGQAF